MRRAAIIQARMGSTRLPGKVLMPLGGTTVLGCVIERVRSAALDDVVVATSRLPDDDRVADFAAASGARVWRGDERDVLGRFQGAAADVDAEIVVRVTADCPLIDGALIAQMLGDFDHGDPADYLSNTLTRTYPRGLDAEIFTRAALDRAAAEARLPYEREHVTPYLYRHPEIFRLVAYTDPSGADRSSMRWTLDTPEDYAFLRAVFDRLAVQAAAVSTGAVLEILEREPALTSINAAVRQKEFEA